MDFRKVTLEYDGEASRRGHCPAGRFVLGVKRFALGARQIVPTAHEFGRRSRVACTLCWADFARRF